jgi:hypothetical protein
LSKWSKILDEAKVFSSLHIDFGDEMESDVGDVDNDRANLLISSDSE